LSTRAADGGIGGSRFARWLDGADRAIGIAAPALLFGLRMWASVSLALYVVYWLELDNPYWAGTTAALVCQPQLGASLRKGWFRLIGTIIGAVMAVVLAALFPQSRIGYLAGLALWGAVCALAATVLRNFASYAAALAGFTAAIIASDDLGSVGGLGGQAFILAVTRASEISIGIVCAGIVLAGTDLGTARRRLAAQVAGLAAEITGRLAGSLLLAGPAQAQTREVRRGLIRRVVALDPIIDQAIGESSSLRYRSRILQAAVDGLFAALCGWRVMARHLEMRQPETVGREAAIVWQTLPPALRTAPVDGNAASWTATPTAVGRSCEATALTLAELPAATPSLRLVADRVAEALRGVSLAVDGLALLADDPACKIVRPRLARLRVGDWLPAFVNAGRAFITIGMAALFWIVTAWPGGASAIAFAMIAVLMFAPQPDLAAVAAARFMIGVLIATAAAAVIEFAVLPEITTFAGFALVIGIYLVPAAALMTQPWPTMVPMFTSMTGLFVAILAPLNQESYDTQQFYNRTLTIVAGIGAAVLAFRVLPPLSPAFRTRRLLRLALRDLRRLARRRGAMELADWQGLVYGRLAVLPATAPLDDGARLVGALVFGNELIDLREISGPAGFGNDFAAVCAAVARGDSAAAIAALRRLDGDLAARPGNGPAAALRLQARAGILAISEALAQYPAYFDAKAPP
jgi:uncharacterized membrane protein YccC